MDFLKLDRKTLSSIFLVCAADGVVGASFGAIAVAGGAPLWLPMLMSALIFAGGAQFVALGIFLSGGGGVIAAITGLLLNVRLIPLSLSISDVLNVNGIGRLVGSHVLTDEAVAFVNTETDPRRRRLIYTAFGVFMYVLWNLGTFLGAYFGAEIKDLGAFGLDAGAPVVLLALVMSSLKAPKIRNAAVIGAVLTLVAVPLLPAGLPILCSLVGVGYYFLSKQRRKAVVEVAS